MQFSLKQVSQPMIVFEMTALKLLEMDTSVSISDLISDISLYWELIESNLSFWFFVLFCI